MHIHWTSRVALVALASASVAVRAEGEQELRVAPNAAAAVRQSTTHLKGLNTATPQQGTLLRALEKRGQHPGNDQGGGGSSPKGRYPADLEFHGGPTLPSVVHHAVFVNPTASCPPNGCWGDPIGFLKDLNKSDFIHVTDQYVGTHADKRYPVGTNFFINYPVGPKPLTDLDIEIIAFSAAQVAGFGYGHIYHVFLVPGQDLCFDSTDTVCYSPDNPSTFFFCAYHSSFDTSKGHVLYSAEPFQDVLGCSVRPGTPNGQKADSTNDTLSHESIEAITDPDGDAYWNSTNLSLFGQEIGDECIFLFFQGNNVFSDPTPLRLNGKPYALQPEYSNRGHICASAPVEDE